MELEDDLFFADLSKQISLLIMDEDEDPLACCRANSPQVFHHTSSLLLLFYSNHGLLNRVYIHDDLNMLASTTFFSLSLEQSILLHILLSSMSKL